MRIYGWVDILIHHVHLQKTNMEPEKLPFLRLRTWKTRHFLRVQSASLQGCKSSKPAQVDLDKMSPYQLQVVGYNRTYLGVEITSVAQF